MILNEPAHTPYDLKFRLFGIPVRVHPMFWLVTLFLNFNQPPVFAAIWMFAVFVSILVHELGHAFLARACGFVPHIVLMGFGGLAIYRPTYHNWKRQVLISLAGPAAGFLLAAFLAAGLYAARVRMDVDIGFPYGIWVNPIGLRHDYLKLYVLVAYLFEINILWGLINLLPVIPLDGGQVSRELFVAANRSPQTGLIRSLQLSLMVAGAVAALVLIQLQEFYLALMFGYLAYQSFSALRYLSGGRPW